ncbi:hypothetical protein SLA2020_347270 [Shorea laevis]
MASSSSSESPAKLPYFENRCTIEWEYEGPLRTCKCGHFAPRWTCWTEANAGRRFFGCPKYKEKVITVVLTNLSKTFSGTNLGAEKDGDLLLAVIVFDYWLLEDFPVQEAPQAWISARRICATPIRQHNR